MDDIIDTIAISVIIGRILHDLDSKELDILHKDKEQRECVFNQYIAMLFGWIDD